MGDWSNNVKFGALLRRAASLARQSYEVQRQLTEAFENRYGATYSEVDCDSLIDILDYGTSDIKLTAQYADKEMAAVGQAKKVGPADREGG